MGLIDFRVKLYEGSSGTLVRSYGYNGENSTTEFVLPIGIRLFIIFHPPRHYAFKQLQVEWILIN